jgi:hypothetical protein
MSVLKWDIGILEDLIHIYCKQIHQTYDKEIIKRYQGDKTISLCSHCNDVLSYSVEKRKKCPKHPKPRCKDCDIHCYSPSYRESIKSIMAFSGKRYIFYGGIFKAGYYLFTSVNKQKIIKKPITYIKNISGR